MKGGDAMAETRKGRELLNSTIALKK